MTSDDVRAFGRTIPARVSGCVDRVVQLRGTSAREVFVFTPIDGWEPGLALRGWFAEEDPRLVDTYRFDDEPGWAPALVYRRLIPDSAREFFDASGYLGVNGAVDKAPRSQRDVSSAAPMSSNEFWELIAIVGGHASIHGVVALEKALAERPAADIVAFWRRLQLVLRSVRKKPVAESAHEPVMYGSDAFTSWCLAVVAQGADAVAAVGGGGSTRVSEAEWEAGHLLREVAENAEERREGVRPEYLARARSSQVKTLSAAARTEAMLREKYGDGTVDRAPGPRTPVEMEQRGLMPSVVVSRFIVRTPEGCHECLVAQHLDVRGENVDRHLRDGARECAERLGGVMASPIEHIDSASMTLSPTLYEIRRRWAGNIDEYLARHHRVDLHGTREHGGQ